MSADLLPRRLYYIPIVHSQEDLGSLAAAARESTIARFGAAAWAAKQQAAADDWSRISAWADKLPAALPNFRVYQDGLPVADLAAQIVAELAARGSRNHQLLAALAQRGATLMGTESAALLRQEYELARQLLAGGAGLVPQSSLGLLGRRDSFIAQRIADTLRRGESGILFIGALHKISPLLPADIEVRYPLPLSRLTARSG